MRTTFLVLASLAVLWVVPALAQDDDYHSGWSYGHGHGIDDPGGCPSASSSFEAGCFLAARQNGDDEDADQRQSQQELFKSTSPSDSTVPDAYSPVASTSPQSDNDADKVPDAVPSTSSNDQQDHMPAQPEDDFGPVARARPIAIKFIRAAAAYGQCVADTAGKDARTYGKAVAVGDIADAVLSECGTYEIEEERLRGLFESTLYPFDEAKADNDTRQWELESMTALRRKAISVVLKVRADHNSKSKAR